MANKVNRFYNQQRGQYVSQFVPKNLPADLMMRGLANKQKKYDTMEAQVIKLGEYEQRALGEHDTNYVKGKKEELQSFIDESFDQDLASPDFIRKYQKFTNDFKNDDGLKRVANSVAIDDAYQARWKKLKEGSGTDAANEFAYDYQRRREELEVPAVYQVLPPCGCIH